jgi:hypothetical protein
MKDVGIAAQFIACALTLGTNTLRLIAPVSNAPTIANIFFISLILLVGA